MSKYLPRHSEVCALSTISSFYRDGNNEFPYQKFAPVWAERAGKLVLNEVEIPHEDNIVTFLILGLFWYMQGSWRRSHIHKGECYRWREYLVEILCLGLTRCVAGNALQTAHVLNLIGNKTDAATSPLESKMSRRRFWACYLINCHTTNSMFTISPPAKLTNLLLPWREDEFEGMASTSPPPTFGSDSSNGGIYGEMIRAMTHWSVPCPQMDKKDPES